MKTSNRAVLSTLAVGLLLGLSGSVVAESLETQHSVYDLARQESMSPTTAEYGQAGRAGPEFMTEAEKQAAAWPQETRYSVYDLAREQGMAGSEEAGGQMGPSGPDYMPSRTERDDVSVETRFSVYDLAREHDASQDW